MSFVFEHQKNTEKNTEKFSENFTETSLKYQKLNDREKCTFLYVCVQVCNYKMFGALFLFIFMLQWVS